MKICFIMRGLPGSERIRVADFLDAYLEGANAEFVENDWYFRTNRKPFDGKELEQAAKACWERFKELVAKKAETIIVNNSNIRHVHYNHYREYAKEKGYAVVIVTCEHPRDIKRAARESRTDEGTLRMMLRKWEK